MAPSSKSADEAVAVAAEAEDDPEATDLNEQQITGRTTRVLALMPAVQGTYGDLEVTFRATRGLVAQRDVVVCEACVTVIKPDGSRITSCVPVPCPKGIKAPGGGIRI